MSVNLGVAAGVPVVDVQGQVSGEQGKTEGIEQKQPATMENMLRDVSAGLRDNMITARAGLIEQKHADYQRISDYVQASTRTLERTGQFEAEGLPSIRSVTGLNDALRTLHQNLSRIIRDGSAIAEDVLVHLQGEGPGGKIREVFSTLAERAQEASKNLRVKSPDFTETVFLREVADKRRERVETVTESVLKGLKYHLEHASPIPSEAARTYFLGEVEKRVSALLEPLRQDPLNGKVDPEQIAARLREVEALKGVKEVKVPGTGSGPGTGDRLPITDRLRAHLESTYRSLPDSVERALHREASHFNFKGQDAHAIAEIDDMGKGKITFYNRAANGSSVTFTIDDKEPSAAKRTSNLHRVLDDMRRYEELREDGTPRWDATSASYVYESLRVLGSTPPVSQFKPFDLQLSSDEYKIEHGRNPSRGDQEVLRAQEIMEGFSRTTVSLRDGGGAQLSLKHSGQMLEVRLVANDPSSSRTSELTVVTAASALSHRDRFQETFTDLGRAFKALGSSTAPRLATTGVLATMLRIPEAEVRLAQGLKVEKDSVIEMKLKEGEGRIDRITVAPGSELRVSGKAVVIENSTGGKGALLLLDISESIIANSKFGHIAGRAMTCTLRNVGADQITNRSPDSTWAQPGVPFASTDCRLEQCAWATDITGTIQNFSKVRYLKAERPINA